MTYRNAFTGEEFEHFHDMGAEQERTIEVRDSGIVFRAWVAPCTSHGESEAYHVFSDLRDTIAGREVYIYEGPVDNGSDLGNSHFSKQAAYAELDKLIELFPLPDDDTPDNEVVHTLYESFMEVQRHNDSLRSGSSDSLLDSLMRMINDEALRGLGSLPSINPTRDYLN